MLEERAKRQAAKLRNIKRMDDERDKSLEEMKGLINEQNNSLETLKNDHNRVCDMGARICQETSQQLEEVARLHRQNVVVARREGRSEGYRAAQMYQARMEAARMGQRDLSFVGSDSVDQVEEDQVDILFVPQ